jgi:hypothetical protein
MAALLLWSAAKGVKPRPGFRIGFTMAFLLVFGASIVWSRDRTAVYVSVTRLHVTEWNNPGFPEAYSDQRNQTQPVVQIADPAVPSPKPLPQFKPVMLVFGGARAFLWACLPEPSLLGCTPGEDFWKTTRQVNGQTHREKRSTHTFCVVLLLVRLLILIF